MSIREAAVKAFEPVQKSEEHIFEDRVKRACRHFREQFKEDVEPTIDDQHRILFDFEGLELWYVGNIHANIKPYTGAGWHVREACAKCKEPSPVRFVATLAQLGRYLHDEPEWECPRCNKKVA